jgi:hypothetical protein
MRINFSDTASAMLLRVSVDFRETPESMVTPVKAELLLKDSTVTEISSPLIDGTKHSIADIYEVL